MKVLVIGGGGREHALVWKLAQSPHVDAVYVAPGNSGTANEPKCHNIDIVATDIENIELLIDFAKNNSITYTLVGPEAPLCLGIVDKFLQHNLKIWGPTQYCAQLESSKAFAKAFMIEHHIPTAKFAVFTDEHNAKNHLIEHFSQHTPQISQHIVIKADGLASGKGVLVTDSLDEANRFIDSIFISNKFGGTTETGNKVVIEEFLAGVEASFIVMIDGTNILTMASSQDHKRLLEGDKGQNTGGMGAYSPTPIITDAIHSRVIKEIIQPVIDGMAASGHRYTGFLYAGLMIDPRGNPKTLEFNCRMGDPETQPIMMRLESDFSQIVLAGIEGQLDTIAMHIKWNPKYAIGVVLATAGYPDNPRLGDVVHGLDNNSDINSNSSNYNINNTKSHKEIKVFHAGAKKDNHGNIVTSGGRALCVVALDDKLVQAKDKVYAAINNITFDGMQYRTDIGYQIPN
jgi:phosphoribosylamine--glycine ligase